MYPPLSLFDRTVAMFVYEKFDWLSVTFPQSVGLKDLVKYLPDSMLKRIKSPIPVYGQAYEYCGVKFLLGHPKAGIHMIISGKPLDSLRLIHDYEFSRIHDMIREQNGKPSRVDLAVDVMSEPTFTVGSVQERLLSGGCATRLKGSKFIGENGEIETLYVGAMDSKSRKIRIYNKGLESGGEIANWVRIEYEKRRGARSTYQAVLNGESIASIIKSAIDFPKWDLWQKIIGSSIAVIPREYLSGVTDLNDSIDWVTSSAAPAIARIAFEQLKLGECEDIHDAPIFTSLSDAIANKLRELIHQDTIDSELIG